MKALAWVYLVVALGWSLFGTICALTTLAGLMKPISPGLMFFPPFALLLFGGGLTHLIAKSLGHWRMIDEASWAGRLLKTARAFVAALAIGLFFYGIVVYLDAPIRPAGDGTYISKTQRKRYTLAQYEAFNRWESALFSSFPAMVLLFVSSDLAFGHQVNGNRRRKKA